MSNYLIPQLLQQFAQQQQVASAAQPTPQAAPPPDPEYPNLSPEQAAQARALLARVGQPQLRAEIPVDTTPRGAWENAGVMLPEGFQIPYGRQTQDAGQRARVTLANFLIQSLGARGQAEYKGRISKETAALKEARDYNETQRNNVNSRRNIVEAQIAAQSLKSNEDGGGSGGAYSVPIPVDKPMIESARKLGVWNDVYQKEYDANGGTLKKVTWDSLMKRIQAVTGKPASAWETQHYQKKAMARTILRGLAEGRIPANFDRTIDAYVKEAAAEMGYDLDALTLAYKARERRTSTMNSSKMQSTIQDIKALNPMLDILLQVNDEARTSGLRGGLRLGNMVAQGLARNGLLGGIPAELKSRIDTSTAITKDDLALVFRRGGVPTKESYELAGKIFDPYSSPDVIEGAIAVLRIGLNARLESIQINNEAWTPQPISAPGTPGRNAGARASTPAAASGSSGKKPLNEIWGEN